MKQCCLLSPVFSVILRRVSSLRKMKSSGVICGAPAGVWKRERTSIKPPKANEGREVRTFKSNELNCVQMISLRETCRSSAAVQQKRASRHRGPASFVCALPGCRVLRAALANSCEMLLLRTLLFSFLSPPPFLSSSLQSRQQGLRTPKVFIQSKPRGDFHQLDERLRLSSHDVSRPLTHQAFIMATPPAQRLPVFSSHLNGF